MTDISIAGESKASSTRSLILNINIFNKQSRGIRNYKETWLTIGPNERTTMIKCCEEYIVIYVAKGNLSVIIYDQKTKELIKLSGGDKQEGSIIRIKENSIFYIENRVDEKATLEICYLENTLLECEAKECELVSELASRKDVSLQTDITNYIKEEMPGIIRAKNMNFVVKLSDIETLRSNAIKTAGTYRARICLHTSNTSRLHSMIILMKKNSRVQSAMHLDKDESITLIKGDAVYHTIEPSEKDLKQKRINVGCFNSKRYCHLRTNKYIIHQLIPTSSEVIFLENTTGPFNRSATIEFDHP